MTVQNYPKCHGLILGVIEHDVPLGDLAESIQLANAKLSNIKLSVIIMWPKSFQIIDMTLWNHLRCHGLI
jgi:hypothetical protein